MNAEKITPVVASHVLWFYDCGGYEPGSFTRLLIAAIGAADPSNRHKLRLGFPQYVAAVEEIQVPGGGVETLQAIAGTLIAPKVTEPLIDPDCRDGKCGSCMGGPCEHECHQTAGAS